MNVRGLNTVSGIVYNYLKSTFDIDTIVPLFFQGIIAGCEFLTYDAKKLYFCLNLGCSMAPGPVIVSQCNIQFYDAAHAAFLSLRDSFVVYDTSLPAVRYPRPAGAEISNIYFSCFSVVYYTEVRFIGYKITLV